jgi:hypothetical protein
MYCDDLIGERATQGEKRNTSLLETIGEVLAGWFGRGAPGNASIRARGRFRLT